jgi:starch synthase
VEAFTLDLSGLVVYLIDGPPIEHSPSVYSTNLEADGFKYIYFSQAALNLPKQLNWKPDILHANDWHTSAAVYSLAVNKPIDPFYRHTLSVLTIHNLPYMGSMTSPALAAFDLPPAENTSLPRWANHLALPLGLLTADKIVAVSPGYAREIMTEEFGSGLQVFLRAMAGKITGILNGLDTERWDPATDQALGQPYSVDNLSNRMINKRLLQAELGLEEDAQIPVFSMVTRMDPQKGVDLAVEAFNLMLKAHAQSAPPVQAIFLGMGNPVVEQSVQRLEQEFPQQVRARIAYDERLSRYIYAGADMLLMPSRYEPCGLAQMIAMRYGCIPLAHATGGLSDTIQDPLDSDHNTGFLFQPASSHALLECMLRAITLYTQSPQDWRAMQLRAMQQDFSWNSSAAKYVELYKQLTERQG